MMKAIGALEDQKRIKSMEAEARPISFTASSAQAEHKDLKEWLPTAVEFVSLPKLSEPTESEVLLALARKNVGVLVRLKNSARNCRLVFSEIRVFLKSEKSKFVDPGPRATCRAESPKRWISAPLRLGTVPWPRPRTGDIAHLAKAIAPCLQQQH